MGFFTQDLVRRTASKHPDAPRASVSGPHGPSQARWDSPAQHIVVFAILVALVVVLRNL